MNSHHTAPSGPSPVGTVYDHQVEAFLTVNNPCYSHFPTEMRDAVREYLQRQMDGGDLTQEHLEEYERKAAASCLLGD